MNARVQRHRDYGFGIWLLTGAFIAAGLATWFLPRPRGLRERLTDAAKGFGELTRKGQSVRDDVADAVARGADAVARGAHEVERSAHDVERGAHEVGRYATAAKTDGAVETRKYWAADRPASKAHSL